MFDRLCLPTWIWVSNYIVLAAIIFMSRRIMVDILVGIGRRFIIMFRTLLENYRFVFVQLFLIFFTSIFGIYLETALKLAPTSWFPLSKLSISIPFTIITLISLGLFLIPLIKKFYKILRIQKINNQHSWVQYVYFSFVAAPIFIWIIYSLRLFPDIWDGRVNYDIFLYNNILMIIIRLLWMIAGVFIYILARPISQNEQREDWKFAPFSVNSKADRFNWQSAADREAKNILNIDKYVSIILIDGKQGDGKSSYARMIVDSLIDVCKSKILYTYISLTETNQEKDFSKMFLERCFATLNERYPKINLSNALPIIREGLRDNGYGLLSPIIELLSRFNVGIFETKSLVHDPSCSPRKYVQENVAEKFGYIQGVNETLWLIQIDEIDRAPTNEIYRMIETIERYKHDGRTGLPTKIVFVLCVDRLTLLKNMEGNND